MLSGVYLTDDTVVDNAPRGSVEEEKARLRRRLEELERRETN